MDKAEYLAFMGRKQKDADSIEDIVEAFKTMAEYKPHGRSFGDAEAGTISPEKLKYIMQEIAGEPEPPSRLPRPDAPASRCPAPPRPRAA